MKKPISDIVQGLKDTIATKMARMDEIMDTAAEEERTTSEEESTEYDALDAEVKSLRDDLARQERRLALDATTKATAVVQKTISDRGGVTLKQTEELEPGIEFARVAMIEAHAKGNPQLAFRLAEKHYPQADGLVNFFKAKAEGLDIGELFQQKATGMLDPAVMAKVNQAIRTKATIAAGDTTNTTWAAPLVNASNWSAGFIEFLRAQSLIGQAQFAPAPFNVDIPRQTGGGTGYWVGEGKAKPLTSFAFDNISLRFNKVASIAVITKELARFSDPSAERIVRDQLAEAVIATIDTSLFDLNPAVSGIRPAGLLNGVAPVTTGAIDPSDPVSIECALLALWAPWNSTFMGRRPAYYTTPAAAMLLAASRTALGARAFPNVTRNGGNIDGIPVRVSQYLANAGGSGGAPFILVDEAEILLADDGSVTVDFSDQATLEMSNTPAASSNPTVVTSGTPFVNMWQTNSIALRAERFLTWLPRRAGAVQWIDGFPTAC